MAFCPRFSIFLRYRPKHHWRVGLQPSQKIWIDKWKGIKTHIHIHMSHEWKSWEEARSAANVGIPPIWCRDRSLENQKKKKKARSNRESFDSCHVLSHLHLCGFGFASSWWSKSTSMRKSKMKSFKCCHLRPEPVPLKDTPTSDWWYMEPKSWKNEENTTELPTQKAVAKMEKDWKPSYVASCTNVTVGPVKAGNGLFWCATLKLRQLERCGAESTAQPANWALTVSIGIKVDLSESVTPFWQLKSLQKTCTD